MALAAVLPEPGHRDEDDAGVQRAKLLVREPHGRHHAGPEVLQHDVGLCHEGREDFLALGAAQVQADALLAAAVDGEIDALSADHGGMPPCFLAAEWLDLDDLGPEVGQEHAAAGPRLEPRPLENADAVAGGDHRGPPTLNARP